MTRQSITRIRVYPGADASFTLFNDDGTTYAYENGGGSITQLKWNDAAQKLSHDGAPAWTASDADVVEIVRQK